MTPARQLEADRWKAADELGLARMRAKEILAAYPRGDRHEHSCTCESCMKLHEQRLRELGVLKEPKP